MSSLTPTIHGLLPKRPVIWFGEIWLILPSGEKDTRSWRSNHKITKDQVREVLHALLDRLIGEHGRDTAIHSGFTVRSR